jgi:hypothetical protein
MAKQKLRGPHVHDTTDSDHKVETAVTLWCHAEHVPVLIIDVRP